MMDEYEKIADLIKQGNYELVDMLVDKLGHYRNGLEIISGQNQQAYQQLIASANNPANGLQQFAQMYLEEEDMISSEYLENVLEVKNWVESETNLGVSIGDDQDCEAVVSLQSALFDIQVRYNNTGQTKVLVYPQGGSEPFNNDWGEYDVRSHETDAIIDCLSNAFMKIGETLQKEHYSFTMEEL